MSAPQSADLAAAGLTNRMEEALKKQFGADSMAGSVIFGALGFIPGLGEAMGIADMGQAISGYQQDQQFIEEYSKDIKFVGEMAAAYGYFGFEAVVVPLPDGSQKVFTYPGEETAQRVSEFNSLLSGVPGAIEDAKQLLSTLDDVVDDERKKKVQDALDNLYAAERLKQEIGYPITVQAIQSYPGKIVALRLALHGGGLS